MIKPTISCIKPVQSLRVEMFGINKVSNTNSCLPEKRSVLYGSEEIPTRLKHPNPRRIWKADVIIKNGPCIFCLSISCLVNSAFSRVLFDSYSMYKSSSGTPIFNI